MTPEEIVKRLRKIGHAYAMGYRLTIEDVCEDEIFDAADLIDYLLAENARQANELKTVRHDTLEEAANVAEGVFPKGSAHTYSSENADIYIAQESTCGFVASHIRALKGK